MDDIITSSVPSECRESLETLSLPPVGLPEKAEPTTGPDKVAPESDSLVISEEIKPCCQSLEISSPPLENSMVALPGELSSRNEMEADSLVRIEQELGKMRKDLTESHEHLTRIEEALTTVRTPIDLLPRQIRLVAGKVDGLMTSISEPRYRALLSDLLRIYDLIEQIIQGSSISAGLGSEVDHFHNYEILRTQIRQILIMNGLSEILAEGIFNPELHKAVGRVRSDDPSLDNRIRQIRRVGFRTDQNILRYAEVEVWYYAPEKKSDELVTTTKVTLHEPGDSGGDIAEKTSSPQPSSVNGALVGGTILPSTDE